MRQDRLEREKTRTVRKNKNKGDRKEQITNKRENDSIREPRSGQEKKVEKKAEEEKKKEESTRGDQDDPR